MTAPGDRPEGHAREYGDGHSTRLPLDAATGEFWSTRSLAELAAAQGVEAVVDVETLQDDSVSDEEAEAFMAALGR